MKTRILGSLLLLALAVPAIAADSYQVIVNARNPIRSISKSTLRDFYLGKVTRWPDGSAVRPIDLPESSTIREAFSKKALGRDTAAVKSYWLAMVFSGRGTPPVQFETDEKVLSTVRTSPGSIGYVAATTAPGDGVKTIPVTD